MAAVAVFVLLGGFEGRPASTGMQDAYRELARPALVIIGRAFDESGVAVYSEADLPRADELRSGSWADPFQIFGGVPRKTFSYVYSADVDIAACATAAGKAEELLRAAGLAGDVLRDYRGRAESFHFGPWLVSFGYDGYAERCRVRLFGFV